MTIERACGDEDGRFKAIFFCVPECVKRIGADGRIIDINPAGLAMIEARSAEEVCGRDLLEMIDPAYRRSFRDAIASVFAGNAVQLQFEVVGLHGRRLWMDQSAAPLFDRAGNVVEMVAISRDVTAQRAAEVQLLRAKVAEEVDRSRTLFFASVGNELKTPLDQIIGYGELLKEGALELGRDDQLADLDRILQASAYLLSMINQMLAVSLADARRTEPAGAFDLADIVDDVVARINPIVRAAGAEIAIDLAGAPPTWMGDRQQIDQCLSSALSATAALAGGATISLSAGAVFDRGAAGLQFDICARGEGLGVLAMNAAPAKTGVHSIGAARLELARSTARLIGGDLEIVTASEGARLVLRVPACPEARVASIS